MTNRAPQPASWSCRVIQYDTFNQTEQSHHTTALAAHQAGAAATAGAGGYLFYTVEESDLPPDPATCQNCKGRGTLLSFGTDCHHCQGTGTVPVV